MDRKVAVSKKVTAEEVLTAEELAKYKKSKAGTKTFIELGNKLKDAQRKYDLEQCQIKNHEQEAKLERERKRSERAILERDTDIEITDELSKVLEHAMKTTHARERFIERKVELVRLLGALKIRNEHVKLKTLNSNFRHYGVLNVLRDEKKEIQEVYIDEEILGTGWRKLPIDKLKNRLFYKPEDFEKAKQEDVTHHHITFYIFDEKVRQILMESPDDPLPEKILNRNQYSSKQLLFGRDDNPKQLKIILNPTMESIVTMNLTGGKKQVKSTNNVIRSDRVTKGELRTIFAGMTRNDDDGDDDYDDVGNALKSEGTA